MRHPRFFVLALPVLILAGCASPVVTASPTPTLTPTVSETAAPTRPEVPLAGDCSRLASDAEVSAATGVAHTARDLNGLEQWTAELAGGLSCTWNDAGGVRTVWLTVFAATTLPGTHANVCSEPGYAVYCFFTRTLGEYRVDGYVAAGESSTMTIADAEASVEELLRLAEPRLADPVPPPWSPAGGWPRDLECADLSSLDLTGLLESPSGPFRPEIGGFAPTSVFEVNEATGYLRCFWESASLSVGVDALPGGAWILETIPEMVPTSVAGADAAGWIPDPDPDAAVAASPGVSPLAVSVGVNLVILRATGEPDTVTGLAADLVALLAAVD